MGMNKEDEELVRMVNPTLKRRETILFFLIVVINGLKCIVSDIGLDTCARGRWRSAPVSLKRASAAPQSKKLCCVIPFSILIIFRSIIQFLVVLFPLLLWLHHHVTNFCLIWFVNYIMYINMNKKITYLYSSYVIRLYVLSVYHNFQCSRLCCSRLLRNSPSIEQ